MKSLRIWEKFLDGPSWMRASLFQRRLRRYKSATVALFLWTTGIYDRLLTRSGRVLALLFLLLLFYSTILMRSPVLFLLFLVSAVLLVECAAGFFFSPRRLNAERVLPQRVRAGAEFDVTYRYLNKGRIFCPELLSDPYLGFREIRRTTAWEYLTVPAHAVREIRVGYRARRRGVYPIPCALVENAFPFQLFKHTRVFGSPTRLIVHPSYPHLRSLRMADGTKLQKQSVHTISLRGESLDFHGCREYRNGDSPRKIHWRASARRGQLVVKEFQSEMQNRAVLILDNRKPPIFDRGFGLRSIEALLNRDLSLTCTEDFEASVSLAAALAETLSELDYRIDLFASGSRIHRFNVEKYSSEYVQILDILSTVRQENEYTLDEISQEILEEIAEIGLVFYLVSRVDCESHKFQLRLADAGASVRTFLTADERSAKAMPEEYMTGVEVIPPNDIHGGVLDL